MICAACGGSPPPAPPPPPTAPVPAAVSGYRLPDDARPQRYDLELTIDPSKDGYTGTVGIDLAVQRETNTVWLHAVDLKIKSAQVTAAGQTLVARVVPGHDDMVGFLFDRPLALGTARLTVSYEGTLDKERSQGLYRVSEGSGPDDWYAYTFFESLDARRAFPCFDEPTYKVPWKLVFHVKQEHVALANAKVEKEIPEGNGMKTVVFEESKPLPSYLVAFVVGPFDLIDAPAAGHHGTPLRFVVPKGRGAETRYAAESTPRFVGLLEDYFDMPYPYGKLDVAVVPRFWGTMEHPGLVALGQPLTLIPPSEETPERKQRYANIAIHELAHYWFGDYVTMNWWDDIWLNEAFASWMDKKITQAFEPSWNVVRNGLRQRSLIMNTDSRAHVIKVREPVQSSEDIGGGFSGEITYGKGSLVIRMFEQFVGPEKFQKAIQRYMRERAWKTATSEDFFAVMNAELGPEIGPAFASFVEQRGVPLVSAQTQCAQGGKGGATLTLSQKRFVPTGATLASSSSSESTMQDTKWQIPICVRYGSSQGTGTACTMLESPQGTLALDPDKGCPDWLMLNANAAGYYRSSYDAAGVRALLDKAWTAAPQKPGLGDLEKIALMSDLAALTDNGAVRLGDALGMLPAMLGKKGRAEPYVYQGTFEIVHKIRRELLSKSSAARYAKFIRALYGDKARALGWKAKPNDDSDTRVLRARLLELVGVAGDDRALQKEARGLAIKWLADRSTLDDDMVPTVLAVAGRTRDKDLWERLKQAAHGADRFHRPRMLEALGGFVDPDLTSKALDLVLGSEFDRRDSVSALRQALSDLDSREQAYAFLKKNFDAITGPMRADDAVHLVWIANQTCDEAHRADAAAFFPGHVKNIYGAAKKLDDLLEETSLCAASQELQKDSVEEFLKKYQ